MPAGLSNRGSTGAAGLSIDWNMPRSIRKKVMGHKTDAMDERYGIVDFEDAAAVKDIMASRRRPAAKAKTTAKKSMPQLKAS